MTPTTPTTTWARVLLPFIPVLLAGAVAYGTLQSQVARNREVLTEKASRERVDLQYQALATQIADLTFEVRQLRAELQRHVAR